MLPVTVGRKNKYYVVLTMETPAYIYDRYSQRYAVEVEEDSELSF
jgi:hypothetical protein